MFKKMSDVPWLSSFHTFKGTFCLLSLLPFLLIFTALSQLSPFLNVDFFPSVVKAASIFSIKVQLLLPSAFLPNMIPFMLSIGFPEWMVLFHSWILSLASFLNLCTFEWEHNHFVKPLSPSQGQLHLFFLSLPSLNECLFSVLILLVSLL